MYLLKDPLLDIHPPEKLKVKLFNQIKKYQGSAGGLYFLKQNLINGFQHWISKDGFHAIWWQKELAKWIIGHPENLGKSIGSIFGLVGEDNFPHQISFGWSFATVDGFIEAGPDDISILDWTNMDDSKLFLFHFGKTILFHYVI